MSISNVLIITGPTASGKTQLSEMIAESCPCEIINADVGQFYKPLSVGTAKPDLANVKYKHHLFDLLDTPQDLSVAKYRTLVIDLVNDICSRDKIPVVVGGSLFYIKSLFFPTLSHQESSTAPIQLNISDLNKDQQWELLQKIDPDRAAMLHPNDNYRISRALEIWRRTGIKPSMYKPVLQTPFNALIVYVEPESTVLKDRIKLRTSLMINSNNNIKFGWIEEAQRLIGTEWEDFLKIKNLIGYPEIFDWIKAGKNKNELPELINKIQIKTVQYSKRQRTFWKSFQNQLFERMSSVQVMSVGLPDAQTCEQVLAAWHAFSNK